MKAQTFPKSARRFWRRKSHRLLRGLARYDEAVVLTHNNPDPDGIAAGWAVYALVRRLLPLPVRFLAGGQVSRAENRQMVESLGPPIELVDQFRPTSRCGVVLVDCSPQSSNHLLYEQSVAPLAVIDHHDAANSLDHVAVSDVRCDVVASASIATAYLYEQHLEPGRDLATGLFYAIRSELPGETSSFSRLDRFATSWLSQKADLGLLAKIETAPLPQTYYRDLALALHNVFRVGNSCVCLLPRADSAEIVAEVADLLIRCEGIDRVLCGAPLQDDLFVSVRTTRGFDAAQLLRETLRDLGHGGGHTHRAGGRIPLPTSGERDALQHRLLERWWHVCGVPGQAAERLVPESEIVEHPVAHAGLAT
jgi:nanoRNase/pAp phosphatase (c-di-AMP/oligoRNAs hydrolase)